MKRTDKVMNTIRKTDLRLPCSWNECSTERLELISRIILEQIARSDRYHPFDMRNVERCLLLVRLARDCREEPRLVHVEPARPLRLCLIHRTDDTEGVEAQELLRLQVCFGRTEQQGVLGHHHHHALAQHRIKCMGSDERL